MRGTELTEEQIASARSFCERRRKDADQGPTPHITDETVVQIPFGQFIRVVAWYGALRFKAGRDGNGGTLEKPGEMEVLR